MTAMLHLRDILPRVNYRLNYSPLPQQEFVRIGQRAGNHILAEFGYPFYAPLKEQVMQRLGEIALVPKDFAKELTEQVGDGLSVIGIGGGKSEIEQCSRIADDKMQLEAEKPARTGLASGGNAREDFVLSDTGVMTDSEGGGINETDARATA